MRRFVRAACVTLGLTLAITGAASGQGPPDMSVKPELRVDAIGSDGRVAIQAGGGVQIPAGWYARIGVIGAVGADFLHAGQQASGRLDVFSRFLFDPFRQTSWGLSAGAGVSLRLHEGGRVQPVLLAVMDLEGPRGSNGVAPAFQVGLGGGIRVGAAVRWGAALVR